MGSMVEAQSESGELMKIAEDSLGFRMPRDEKGKE